MSVELAFVPDAKDIKGVRTRNAQWREDMLDMKYSGFVGEFKEDLAAWCQRIVDGNFVMGPPNYIKVYDTAVHMTMHSGPENTYCTRRAPWFGTQRPCIRWADFKEIQEEMKAKGWILK